MTQAVTVIQTVQTNIWACPAVVCVCVCIKHTLTNEDIMSDINFLVYLSVLDFLNIE